ncbi:hypothetical protein KKG45_10485 [bacterium]|nr:hypothetical protein [bacterium]MBU1073664.1 hypothetical protein [bacterium]MBU1674222.1 hypothetical protein [bacterium]
MKPLHGIVVCAIATLCCAGRGEAQTGGLTSPTIAASPDTATLLLDSKSAVPVPSLRFAGPDSILFGDEIIVHCAFPAAAGDVSLDSLISRTPWAEVTGAEKMDEPAADGTEVAISLRLGRVGPYRLAWGDGHRTEQVFHVTGRLGPTDQPSPLRDPRSLGWYRWRLLLALLAALALLLLILRLRRRRDPEPSFSDLLTPPAWMPAAVSLRDLADGGLAARGEGRAFLHELATIYRRFLAGRFHIKAVEMTPDEIAEALALRRYPAWIPARAVAILSRCDLLRFAPDEVAVSVCLAQLRAVIDAVAETRVMARYTPVPPELEIEAHLSWDRLREIVPQAVPAPEGGGRV